VLSGVIIFFLKSQPKKEIVAGQPAASLLQASKT
jgi:hypothetical protein